MGLKKTGFEEDLSRAFIVGKQKKITVDLMDF